MSLTALLIKIISILLDTFAKLLLAFNGLCGVFAPPCANPAFRLFRTCHNKILLLQAWRLSGCFVLRVVEFIGDPSEKFFL